MKKIITMLSFILLSVLLVSCKDEEVKDVFYDVIFNTTTSEKIANQSIKEGGFAIKPSVNPTKENYTFEFWVLEGETSEWIFTTRKVESNITLVATYKENEVPPILEKVTVTFDLAGGTGNFTTLEIEKNTKITNPGTPNKTDYKFVGWYLENEKFDFTSLISKNIVLVAKYEIIPLVNKEYFEGFEFLKVIKENGGNSSEYLDYTLTDGDSGIDFELKQARIDIGMKKDEQAITIGGFEPTGVGPGLGYIKSAPLEDGISYLEFDGRLPFSPKSTYPQVNGSDKAQNVIITIIINDEKIKQFKFDSDDTANKGQKFVLDGIDFRGTSYFQINISSGHRLTLDNIKWKNNIEKATKNDYIAKLDFEDLVIKEYDIEPTLRVINGVDFMVQEVRSLASNIHNEKELPYMNKEVNDLNIIRLRGKGERTYTGFLYNETHFDKISKVTFLARLFGSGEYFPKSDEYTFKVLYQEKNTTEWIEITTYELTENFKEYSFDVNKENVRIKFELVGGTINLDNIIYYS